jgi:hypothetical protein
MAACSGFHPGGIRSVGGTRLLGGGVHIGDGPPHAPRVARQQSA